MAEPFCRAISCSTLNKSSRTRSKISLAVRSAMATSRLLQRNVSWGPRKPEKATKIRGGCGGEFFSRQVSHIREGSRYLGDVGRLVALAPLGLRRQKGRVGLNQKAIQRQRTRHLAQHLRFRIGDVTSEGDQKPHLDSLPCLFERAAEAMEDTPQRRAAPPLLQNTQAVGPGLAAMDDDGELRR